MFRINADTEQRQDITQTPEQARNLKFVTACAGQGAINDVVLLGGQRINPATGGLNGIVMYAYEGSTGKFLGEGVLPEYANVRRGEAIKGQLYFGVRMAGTGTGGGGAIIKWPGSKQDPLKFEVVARDLASEPGYIIEHDNHIVTAGWTTSHPGQGPRQRRRDVPEPGKSPPTAASPAPPPIPPTGRRSSRPPTS